MIHGSYPQAEFEFVNLGISGDETVHLLARFESDFVDVQPDIVSVMIGINDVWRNYDSGRETTDECFEANLRQLLEGIKTRTNALLLVIQPILLDVEDKLVMRSELNRKQAIVAKVADEYADMYLPMDEIFHTEATGEPAYYAADGVHPTADGACYIGEHYLGAVSPLIEELLHAKSNE